MKKPSSSKEQVKNLLIRIRKRAKRHLDSGYPLNAVMAGLKDVGIPDKVVKLMKRSLKRRAVKSSPTTRRQRSRR